MRFIGRSFVLALILGLLHYPIGGAFAPGPMFEPMDGVWSSARAARAHGSGALFLDGMDVSVDIRFDERGVPHIYAESDQDATIAFGYIVARDRLFQMDFIHRLATGHLSELLGQGAVATDRFFLRNGIADAVRRSTQDLLEEHPREREIVSWYAQGANKYLESLTPATYPLEYRLMGAEPPSEFTPEFTMSLFAFMAYDLSFRTSDIGLEGIEAAIGESEFAKLYPRYSVWERPIVPVEESSQDSGMPGNELLESVHTLADSESRASQRRAADVVPGGWTSTADDPLYQGFAEGKGSNNWAVTGARSSTGMPILAGDMHLALSLPAIWYEAHIVTPTTNTYGVTFPSVPAIVEGITPTTAWTFTNTGADQLDTYRVELDESRTKYLFDGEWEDLVFKTDTIFVKNSDPIAETVAYTHHGPVLQRSQGDFAIQWVGHESGSTFAAVWDMNRASNYDEFEMAIRQWDYPMQNILYAGSDSVIAIRSTGYLPIRSQGEAFGVQDGTTSDTEWIGRVAFDELPHSVLPAQGFLTSTNQRPAPKGYPYYLGRNWGSIYRSIRIDDLLRSKKRHSPDDVAGYQSDVVAVQAQLFLPHIANIDSLSESGERVHAVLASFDGDMALNRYEPRLFAWFMQSLKGLMWDEEVFTGGRRPKDIRILDLLESDPNSAWFDLAATPKRESATDLLRMSLEEVGRRWKEDAFSETQWGDIQKLQIRHITRAEELRPLWREGFPFAGYAETLSPAASHPVTASASWRVVVDFSTSPPRARGVYPGGQSGNPLSLNYDAHIEKYLQFEYYDLDLSATPPQQLNTVSKNSY